MDWYQVKMVALELTGVSRDALHIFAGVGGQLFVAALLRRSVASPLPWLAVLGVEVANEAFDLSYETWPDRPMWPGSVKDVLVTMLVPTVLLLLARYAPGLLHRADPAPAEEAAANTEGTDE